MTFRTASAMMVVLLATAVWAQSTPPLTQPAGGRQAVVATRGKSDAQSQTNGVQVPITPRQRMQVMQETLTRMHGLLKQMRAKAASSGSRDPLAKANLDMWELMLGQLDQQFEQLRIATLRADLDARRASLYKQADERAAAAARLAAAQGSGAVPNRPLERPRRVLKRARPVRLRRVQQRIKILNRRQPVTLPRQNRTESCRGIKGNAVS